MSVATRATATRTATQEAVASPEGGDDPQQDTVEAQAATEENLVQEMFSQAKLNDTLVQIVRLARRSLRADGAGVLLADASGVLTSAAASDREASRADALQRSTRQGPSFQVVSREQPVIVTDLRTDSRWRFWAPMAASLGFRSVLSLRLSDGDTSGVLNLYSWRVSAFGTVNLVSGQTFAQHASVAVAVAREREQLLQALAASTELGRAEGILMEQYGVSATQARTVLHRYATHLDEQLELVAERVVRDRTLPTVATST